MLLLRVGFKHATMPTTVTVGTAGWTKLGEKNSGTGASSNGGGDVQVAVFYKEAASASETNPVITFDAGVTAATPSAAGCQVYQKAASEAWLTPVGDGAAISVATSFSATIASHISATVGDLIDAFVVTNDNTTLTVPTFTQASLTLDTVTESPATALSSTTSNDISADGCFRTATAGTSSAAAVVTGTNSVADIGEAWTTRLRVVIAVAASDSTTLADTAARAFTGSRTESDSTTISDTATRAGAFARTMAEGLAVTESAAKIVISNRTATDGASLSDAVARVGTFGRAATDALAASDSIVRILTSARPVSDSLSAGDAATRGGAFARSIVDALAVSDSVSKFVTGGSGTPALTAIHVHTE